MKKTILVVAVAGLSMLAVAQSEKKKEEAKPSNPVVSPRDSSTGMATGKKGNWDLKEGKGAVQDDSQSSNAREAQSGQASGKVQNVSADAAAQTADHSVKAPRDIATGQASGKRQHQPVTMTTTEDAKKPAEPKK